MTKDNLVFGLAGVIAGIVLGVVLAHYSSRPPEAPQFASTAPQSMAGGSMSSQQPPAQGAQDGQKQLPDGHPAIDEAALKSQIAEQEQILKKDPENVEAIVTSANLYFDLKDYDQSAQFYERALKKNPEDVNLITDLGSCFLYMNQPQKALEYYDRSLAKDPKHFQTLMNVGIAKMAMGNRLGAAEAWEKVIQLYPEREEIPMLKGAVEKLRKNPKGTMPQ